LYFPGINFSEDIGNTIDMTFNNMEPDQKKQLIEFYKAMKMATRMFSQGGSQKMMVNLADQIIEELKKDTPDEGRIKDLADRLQIMAKPNH
jgi:hypothetical protein